MGFVDEELGEHLVEHKEGRQGAVLHKEECQRMWRVLARGTSAIDSRGKGNEGGERRRETARRSQDDSDDLAPRLVDLLAPVLITHPVSTRDKLSALTAAAARNVPVERRYLLPSSSRQPALHCKRSQQSGGGLTTPSFEQTRRCPR